MTNPTDTLITIDRLVPGGSGMGKHTDGRTAFVPGAFPGDSVQVEAMDDKKSYLQVTRYKLAQASPERVEPGCPVAKECGGCDWMAYEQKAQESAKLDLLKQALSRTGGVDVSALEIPFHSSPDKLRYRSRVRLQVDGDRCGFFAPKSHELVQFNTCAVASPGLTSAINLIRSLVRQSPDAFSIVRHIEVRVLGDEEELDPTYASAHFVLREGQQRGRGKKPARPASQKERAALAQAVESAREHMSVRIGKDQGQLQSYQPSEGVDVYSEPGAFTQVNEGINRMLVERILKAARDCSASSFLDIYCGSGNFSLPLLSRGVKGVGVELNRSAIYAADYGMKAQSLPGDFEAGPGDRVIPRLAKKAKRHDLVIVDPPRSGAKEIIDHLAALTGKSLLMVSCDPVTLARDIKVLLAKGFRLKGVEAFDMFPQTHHVETLAILTPPAA